MSSRTIAEHKSAFLRSQIRNLSAPLEPAADWRDYAPKRSNNRGSSGDKDDGDDDDDDDDEEGDIPDKVVKDVLAKFHATLRQHNRAVFSSQAVYHVSRQIEGLYWQQVKGDNGNARWDADGFDAGDDTRSNNVFVKGTDYSDETNITRLPDRFDESNITGLTPEAQERYTTLHKRLTSLVSSLNQQQRQLAQYKRLRELLVPYQAPRENIQPNLVMRGGELVGEVEKMRLLVARVSGRLADRNGR